jgi:hypothetical protein
MTWNMKNWENNSEAGQRNDFAFQNSRKQSCELPADKLRVGSGDNIVEQIIISQGRYEIKTG